MIERFFRKPDLLDRLQTTENIPPQEVLAILSRLKEEDFIPNRTLQYRAYQALNGFDHCYEQPRNHIINPYSPLRLEAIETFSCKKSGRHFTLNQGEDCHNEVFKLADNPELLYFFFANNPDPHPFLKGEDFLRADDMLVDGGQIPFNPLLMRVMEEGGLPEVFNYHRGDWELPDSLQSPGYYHPRRTVQDRINSQMRDFKIGYQAWRM